MKINFYLFYAFLISSFCHSQEISNKFLQDLNINLEIFPSTMEKEGYEYYISKNNENGMDIIERFIYNWIFEKQKPKVNLQKRLEEIAKEKESNERFKTLNNITKRTANKIGANNAKVPIF